MRERTDQPTSQPAIKHKSSGAQVTYLVVHVAIGPLLNGLGPDLFPEFHATCGLLRCSCKLARNSKLASFGCALHTNHSPHYLLVPSRLIESSPNHQRQMFTFGFALATDQRTECLSRVYVRLSVIVSSCEVPNFEPNLPLQQSHSARQRIFRC